MLVSNLAVWIIGSYYISVSLFGISQYSIFGFNSSMVDPVTLLWILILVITKNYLRINFRYVKVELFLLIVFIIYAGLETLYGMYEIKSLSLYIQLIRSSFVLLLVYYFMQKMNIIQLNKFIFRFGFYMSIIMIILYGLFLTIGYSPINILEYGEFQSIRFEGFAGDANFYAFLMSVAFLIGYYSTSKELEIKYKYLYMLPIGINIIITISRSVIATLIVSFIVLFFVFEKSSGKKFKKLFWLIILSIFFIILSKIQLPVLNISMYDWYSLRSTQSSPRFDYWMTLYDYFLQQPLFGYGLRASEVLLGGYGNYAHSSYVELFIDYGIVGTIIFLIFMFLIYIKGIKLIKMNSLYKPWVHSYIIVSMLFAGFTLLYWPFLWVIMAIILGGYTFEKNRLNNNII